MWVCDCAGSNPGYSYHSEGGCAPTLNLFNTVKSGREWRYTTPALTTTSVMERSFTRHQDTGEVGLFAVWYGERAMWERLARVLAHTAIEYCSGWSIDIRYVPVTPRAFRKQSLVANTITMLEWEKHIQSLPVGSRVVFCDADVFLLGSLNGLWDREFDLGITVLPEGARFPINTGLVAVRVSEETKCVFREWRHRQVEMLLNDREHAGWRSKYAGINQATLGMLLENGLGNRVDVCELDAVVWNNCTSVTWNKFDPNRTRVVHVKAGLRTAVFDDHDPGDEYTALVDLWNRAERESVVQ